MKRVITRSKVPAILGVVGLEAIGSLNRDAERLMMALAGHLPFASDVKHALSFGVRV